MDYSAVNATSITPYSSGLVLTVCYSVAAVLAGGGNLAILVIFITHRKLLEKNFNVLILNLCVADFAVGALDLPWLIVDNQFGYWPYSALACALQIYCDWGMTFVSIFTLVVISIDRYWAACWSTSYQRYNTRRRVWIYIGGIWSLLIISWTPAFILDRIRNWSTPANCYFDIQSNRAFSVYVVIAGYHIPSCFMIYTYCCVYRKLRQVHISITPHVVSKVPGAAPPLPASSSVAPLASECVAPAGQIVDRHGLKIGGDIVIAANGSASKTMDTPSQQREEMVLITSQTTTRSPPHSEENGVRDLDLRMATRTLPSSNKLSSVSVTSIMTPIIVDETAPSLTVKSLILATTKPSAPFGRSDHVAEGNGRPAVDHEMKKTLSWSRKELKIFKSLTLIILAYLLLWTPCQISIDMQLINPALVSTAFDNYSSLLSYFNSAVNPFLYAIGNAEIKNALKSFATSRCRRH